MNKDILQKEYLEIFEEIEIEEFSNYSLSQLMFNEIFFVQSITYKQLLKVLLLNIFTNKPILKCEINNSDLLLISQHYYRNDHDEYWGEICQIFPQKDLITILSYQSWGDIIKNLSICESFKKIHNYRNIYFKLKRIANKLHRKYFAIQLMQLKNFEKKLKDLQLNPKVAMCFFDSGFYENLAMQYFKYNGAVTITNQHGQPVFRTWDEDRLNQSQILNFKCDFFFAKGEYTKRMFKKAGFDEKSICVVGNLNSDKVKYENDEKDCFGVFLDCPTLEFAGMTNLKLIEISNTIAEKYNLKYYVKTHPQDSYKRYVPLVNNHCLGVYDKRHTIEEVFNRIAFGIIHASAIYLDLINANIKSFRFDSKVEFPLVESDMDLFEDINDFDVKLDCWKKKTIQEKRKYMKELQIYYNGNGNGTEIIHNFVNDLLKERDNGKPKI